MMGTSELSESTFGESRIYVNTYNSLFTRKDKLNPIYFPIGVNLFYFSSLNQGITSCTLQTIKFDEACFY